LHRSSMKIHSIETIELHIPYTSGGSSDTGAWGGKAWQTADVLLVKIGTDEGITGWGEAFGYNVIPATRVAIEKILAPMCIGREALEIESLMLELQQKLHIFGRGGPIIYGISGIDVALWDIAGKAAGKPVHQLLGGGRSELACYASLIRYTDPGPVAENTSRAISQGFRSIKLHEIEVAPVRASREVAGANVDIMLDVNCPWNLQQALDMAKQLQPYALRWLEEPVWPPEDHAALAKIRAQGGIPIAAGENAATLAQYRDLLDAGAVDVLQPSPAKMGGITELRRVFELAANYPVQVVPHSFYDGPAFLGALHVNAALGGDGLVEWRFFDLEARLYGDEAIPRKGMISTPQGPGLGFDPDPTVIKRYRVA
ncbi:MAG: mandelate racemase/muconate lactonizing enzyme family protein, partial [Burkholderiales bacterium]